jgi:hypothetical protein
VTLQLGPGRLYAERAGEWVAIGSVEAMDVQVVDPPRAGLVDTTRLRKALRGGTISWTQTLTRRQTRQVADAFFPGWRWEHWDGPRARAEYHRRTRHRNRRRR